MWDASSLLSALTPKLFVALTSTSSLISGLILIFEWWYFRKNGTSFIEQVCAGQFSWWFSTETESAEPADDGDEFRVWRNPMALLRGAEYARLWTAARRAPLTYHDMNLSAQDHQAWFAPPTPPATPAEEALARAWREREPRARVACARLALRLAPRDPAALLLLAEEDAPTVAEAERVLRQAWRAAEGAARAGRGAGGGAGGAADARAGSLLAHVKRRTGMCLRRLGRLRDAARVFRDLVRDTPPALAHLAPHENLVEVLLEQRLYPEAGAAVARALDAGAPRSACLLYSAALLQARAAGPAAPAAPAARLALHAAVRANPHVPALLLERRALALPPEHVLRGGESEALAYAFCHLRHWRRADAALRALADVARQHAPPPRPACLRRADRDLLADGAARAPRLLAAAALCSLAALAALAAHGWPRLQRLQRPDT